MSDLDEDASEQGPKAEIERLLREALELMKHGHIPGYRKDARRKIADALASLDDVEDKKYIIGKDGQKVHWEHPLELVARGPSGKVIYKPGYEPPALHHTHDPNPPAGGTPESAAQPNGPDEAVQLSGESSPQNEQQRDTSPPAEPCKHPEVPESYGGHYTPVGKQPPAEEPEEEE